VKLFDYVLFLVFLILFDRILGFDVKVINPMLSKEGGGLTWWDLMGG
jgi:hypothetical protein